MTPLGIGARDVLALAREARSVSSPRGPLLVTGVLAEHLARELGAGAEPGSVRTEGDPAGAAALVRVLAGPATPTDEDELRRATRALVPVVAIQTGDASVRLPYVLATDVVACAPGKGFPVDEIARALAAALGRDGAFLARSVPVLREAVERRRVEEGSLRVAALAAKGDGPRLRVLSLAQSRMLSEIRAAGGASQPVDPRATAEAVVPALAASIGTGLLARAVVRRLPLRSRLLESAVAAGATFALATAFRRVSRG